MVKKHPAFEWPSKEETRIWRYMDFAKFVSMLENSGLFFARCHKLGDPFEGSYAWVNEVYRRAVFDHIEVPAKKRDAIMRLQANSNQWIRQWMMVNCWHMNDHESAALWKLYAHTDEAICIQSLFSRLRDSLDDNVYIGIVHYIDYEKTEIPEGNIFHPFLHKRMSFEHEHELRAVNFEPTSSGNPRFWEDDAPDSGIWKSVSIGDLVESVFVAPFSEPWFENLVKSVVEKYGLTLNVVRSKLEEEPFF